jgi:hypothetical protein
MCKGVRASLLLLLVMTGFGGAAAQSAGNQPGASAMETDVAKIKQALLGNWESIAPEIRPSKNPDGTLKPFYLTRSFVYEREDRFELTVMSYADPFAKLAIAKVAMAGHMSWRGDHPIAPGAQKVDFVADEAYAVTPLLEPFAALLNTISASGYAKWELGQKQAVFRKRFAPFGLVEGQTFKEYDLVHLWRDLLFWGARNVDGRGFDTEENRPTNLQIPLVRRL